MLGSLLRAAACAHTILIAAGGAQGVARSIAEARNQESIDPAPLTDGIR